MDDVEQSATVGMDPTANTAADAPAAEPAPVKRGRGRPKGSKTKKKVQPINDPLAEERRPPPEGARDQGTVRLEGGIVEKDTPPEEPKQEGMGEDRARALMPYIYTILDGTADIATRRMWSAVGTKIQTEITELVKLTEKDKEILEPSCIAILKDVYLPWWVELPLAISGIYYAKLGAITSTVVERVIEATPPEVRAKPAWQAWAAKGFVGAPEEKW